MPSLSVSMSGMSGAAPAAVPSDFNHVFEIERLSSELLLPADLMEA